MSNERIWQKQADSGLRKVEQASVQEAAPTPAEVPVPKQTRRGFFKGLFGVAAKTALGTSAVYRGIEELERERGESLLFNADVDRYKARAQHHESAKNLLKKFDPAEEPELVAVIEERGSLSTLELIDYFASKPVRGAEEYDRKTYVQEKIEFADFVPQAVADELRYWMPGLCAQESKFNNDSTSHVGAEGIFQFMPDTWTEMQKLCMKQNCRPNYVPEEGKEPEPLSIHSLVDQTWAAGNHFSNIYKRLYHYAGDELDQIKRVFFGRQGFEQYFLVPLIINSYNAGSKRLADAIIELAAKIPDEAAAEAFFNRHPRYLGYDVFFTLAKLADDSDEGTLARYGEHAREYVPRIRAFAELLHRQPQ